MLGKMGLIGKINLSSHMNEQDVKQEIRSVFGFQWEMIPIFLLFFCKELEKMLIDFLGPQHVIYPSHSP